MRPLPRRVARSPRHAARRIPTRAARSPVRWPPLSPLPRPCAHHHAPHGSRPRQIAARPPPDAFERAAGRCSRPTPERTECWRPRKSVATPLRNRRRHRHRRSRRRQSQVRIDHILCCRAYHDNQALILRRARPVAQSRACRSHFLCAQRSIGGCRRQSSQPPMTCRSHHHEMLR